MNAKLLVIAIAIVCNVVSVAANAETTNFSTETVVNESIKIEGGIRAVVQGFASFEVFQETPTLLTVTVYNNTGGTVYVGQTSELSLMVSTEGWESGTYKIVTLATGETNSQDFLISVE